jgi:Leucine-rich repeat (LRR) protein
LTALRELNLKDTRITSVEPLKELPELRMLYLSGVTGYDDLDRLNKSRSELGLPGLNRTDN